MWTRSVTERFLVLVEKNVLQAEVGSVACDTHPRAVMKTAAVINSCALEAVIWQLCNPCRQLSEGAQPCQTAQAPARKKTSFPLCAQVPLFFCSHRTWLHPTRRLGMGWWEWITQPNLHRGKDFCCEMEAPSLFPSQTDVTCLLSAYRAWVGV